MIMMMVMMTLIYLGVVTIIQLRIVLTSIAGLGYNSVTGIGHNDVILVFYFFDRLPFDFSVLLFFKVIFLRIISSSSLKERMVMRNVLKKIVMFMRKDQILLSRFMILFPILLLLMEKETSREIKSQRLKTLWCCWQQMDWVLKFQEWMWKII